MNAYKGGPGLNFLRGRRGGGGVFPGDGVPTAHSYRNPLSLMIFQGGGGRGFRLIFIKKRWSGPLSHGKTEVIWVLIGEAIAPPPHTHGKSWTLLENVGHPMEIIVFFETLDSQ